MQKLAQRCGVAAFARLMAVCIVVYSLVASQAASGAAAPAANPPVDPNFPPGSTGSDPIAGVGYLGWNSNVPGPGQSPTIPVLVFTPVVRDKTVIPHLDYLGFLDGQGSLIESAIDGGVYLYNRASHVYVKKFALVDDIPPEVLAALKNRKYLYVSKNDRLNTLTDVSNSWWDAPSDIKNTPVIQQAITYYREHAYREKPAHGVSDPNFPPSLPFEAGQRALPVRWNYEVPSGLIPQVMVIGDPGASASYLGFDERGTWVVGAPLQSGLLAWSFRTLTLTRIASRLDNVPRDALARLSNANEALISKSIH